LDVCEIGFERASVYSHGANISTATSQGRPGARGDCGLDFSALHWRRECPAEAGLYKCRTPLACR
jgi:hypothetical protein